MHEYQHNLVANAGTPGPDQQRRATFYCRDKTFQRARCIDTLPPGPVEDASATDAWRWKDSLPDSQDAHLTVELLHQPIGEQTQDERGVRHAKPVDVEVSGSLYVSAIVLLKNFRKDVGVSEDGTRLIDNQFEKALENSKAIFREHFLHNTSLKLSLPRKELEEPTAFTRAKKRHVHEHSRGIFGTWLTSFLGDKGFAFALLKHGCFDFSDLQRCARALPQEATNLRRSIICGAPQSATHTHLDQTTGGRGVS